MIPTLTIEELYAKFKSLSKDELILDVRTPAEYASGHVPGSRNVSHEEVGAHADELKTYRNVYIYCRSGGRVQFACQELAMRGLKNIAGVVSGGMPNWEMNGFPVEK